MSTRGKVILTTMLLASTALAGCVSGPENAPAWYEEHEQTRGYPSLHDVPSESVANTDARHWSALQAEVTAAGAAMKANPRATPAGPTDPAAFIAEAQGDLEETRQAHEP